MGTAVAYLHDTADRKVEIRILDFVTRSDRVLVSADELAKFGKLTDHAPRWSRDGKYLFLLTDKALLRLAVGGGPLQKFASAFKEGEYGFSFDVTSDYRRIFFTKQAAFVQPWLYDALQ